MTLGALQGRALARTVEDVRSLLAQGEAPSLALRSLEALRASGLWSERGDILTASPAIVALGDQLPNPAEAVPAVFSLLPELREAWLRVVRARLVEMGERGDVAALTDAVNNVGSLASELVKVNAPTLAPTAFGELERVVLPAAAHEASAFPVLLRTLAATAVMSSDVQVTASLPDIAFDDPSTAWRSGRLLRLPDLTDTAPTTSVLSGALDDSVGDGDVMRWVLQRPWVFLLSQMVFTKEAWEAERVSGSLAFELEKAHVALFQNPPRVDVVVTLPTGEEVRCGSLAEFVMQTLAQLGVTVLAHRLTPAMLDDRLANVVEALVRREIWRFDHGTGGRRPGYAIHPSFSDACYRALGSRAFYRLGSSITAAIRRVAETWARDRVARAGAAVAGGGAT